MKILTDTGLMVLWQRIKDLYKKISVSAKQTTTSTADGGTNVMTFTFGDGTSTTLSVKNGSKGSDGARGETGAKGEKGDRGPIGETGPQGNSGIADASNKPLINDVITGGGTNYLSAEVGKLGILNYDCSKGGYVTHATLQDAINSVPTTFQKVGLTITYKSGDTIYRYVLKANTWSADPANWFSVEDKLSGLQETKFVPTIPTSISKNNMTLLSSSIEEGKILLSTGEIQSFAGINCITANVKKGDVLYLDLDDAFADVYGVFAIYDNEDNLIYVQKGGSYYTGTGKCIQVYKNGYIKYCIREHTNKGIYRINDTANIDNYALKSETDKLKSLLHSPVNVSIEEQGIKGIYITDGSIDLNYPVWHCIFPSKYSIYKVTTVTGLANGTVDVWYAITFLNAKKQVIGGLTDKQVGSQHLTNYSFSVIAETAYIAISTNNENYKPVLKGISETSYISPVDYSELDNYSLKSETDKLQSETDKLQSETDKLKSVLLRFSSADVSIKEQGVDGIYDTDGSIVLEPLRWHCIFQSNYSAYKVTTDTGLAHGVVDHWYAIAFLNSEMRVIGGLTDKQVGTNDLTEYYFNVIAGTAYISVSVSSKDYKPVLKGQSGENEYINPVDHPELDNYATKEYVNQIVGNKPNKVLWLGTSIPEGCLYPENACKNIGYMCHNMALGSSGIIMNSGVLGNDRDGKDLSESAAEKMLRYKSHIGDGTNGTITQSRYDAMMNWGYDKRIIPYIDGTIDNCDIVVFDHGYNDRDANAMKEAVANFDSYDLSFNKDDSDYNRGTYVGAFCFLVKKIYEVNPNIKIVICSYLENKTGSPEFPNDNMNKCGYIICKLLEKIAHHFNFPYLNMCDYNGFTMDFVPNTSSYISNINTNQGTNYSNINFTGKANSKGDVTMFQYYCPDGTHPNTDKSGRALERITSSITKLLRDI